MLLNSDEPPAYLWDLPWGFGINHPREGLKGEMAEKAMVDRTHRTWRRLHGATLFSVGADFLPSASLPVGKEGGN